MSLTMDYSGIADYEALHADDHERVVTQALGFYSMPLGFGEVTERNAEEVFAAITVYDALCGSPLVRTAEGMPYSLTPQDVHRRVGLRTNAVNGMSVRNNLARIAKERMDEERGNYQRAVVVA